MTKYLRMREMMIVALKQTLEKEKGNLFIAKIIPETAEVIEVNFEFNFNTVFIIYRSCCNLSLYCFHYIRVQLFSSSVNDYS